MGRMIVLATVLGFWTPWATAQEAPREGLRSRLRERIQAMPGMRGRLVPGAPERVAPPQVQVDESEASVLKSAPAGAGVMGVRDLAGRSCRIRMAVEGGGGPGTTAGGGYEGVLTGVDSDWLILTLKDGKTRVWLSRKYVASILVLPEASPAEEGKAGPGAAAGTAPRLAPAREDR